MGNLAFTKSILLILVTAFTLPALAANQKPSLKSIFASKPEPCVVNAQDPAKITPEQMEILKAFETLMNGPVAPLQLKSEDTDIKLEAIDGKIQLAVSALNTEKCERLSPPGKVVDYVQKFNDYIKKGVQEKTLKYAVKLCQDKDGLYIDPSFYGIRINVAPGATEGAVSLNLILPATTSCKDEVKREELQMN